MRRSLLTCLVLLAILSLAACQAFDPVHDESTARMEGVSKPLYFSMAREQPVSDSARSSAPDGSLHLESMWAERKLIRTASLVMEVDSVEETRTGIRSAAEKHGALIAGSSFSRDADGAHRGVITVRIPAQLFEPVLADLRLLGEVKHEEINTQDVTRQYTDLETRLAVKRQTEKRLRNLLENRTGKLTEVLEVERELERVVGDLERMEGERRYYDRQVAVSTISLDLREPGAVAEEESWWSSLADAFNRSLEILAFSVGLLIHIVVFVTPWLVLATIGWFAVRALKRRFSR